MKVFLFDNIRMLEVSFRQLFDDLEAWQKATVNRGKLTKELADCAVPLYVAAESLGVSLDSIATDKAFADMKRGRR